jgi:Tol biopolymer transport system component
MLVVAVPGQGGAMGMLIDRRGRRGFALRARSAVVLAGVAAALVLSSSPPRKAAAAFPGADGLIAFARGPLGVYSKDGAAHWRIYTMHADGSHRRQLTHTRNRDITDTAPVFSPDGGVIAFERYNEHGGVTPFTDIYALNADGSHLRRLTHPESGAAGIIYTNYSPAFLPDGSIMFARTGFAKRESGTRTPPARFTDLWTMGADGSNARQVVRFAGPKQALYLAVSPDGQTVAFQRGDIFAMNADGSNLRQLTHKGAEYGPDFSPDGRRIVFTRLPGWSDRWNGLVETWTVNVDGSGEHRLNRSRGSDVWFGSGPSFSPDGRRIVFERLAPHAHSLYVMNADGSHLHQVEHEKRKTFASHDPAWQPVP